MCSSDLGTLRGVWGLMHDERVPLWLRLLPIPVLVYLASPIDLMPDVIPVLGQLDDILIVGAALWVILRFVPFAVVRSHFVPRGERTTANGGGDDGGNDGTIGGAGV